MLSISILPQGLDACVLQLFLDPFQAVAVQEFPRNHANGLGVLGDDFRFSIWPLLKGEAGVAEGKPSLFVSHANSFGDVAADGFAFCLCKGTQAGQDHFAVHIRGVDVFFLGYHGDAPAFEDSDVLDTVEGIPCKPGNGFCQDDDY